MYITDNKKVTSDLGWKPKVSAEDTLSDIFGWINSNELEIEKSLY